jgi:O-antigen ligase
MPLLADRAKLFTVFFSACLMSLPWSINASTWGAVAFSLCIMFVTLQGRCHPSHYFLMAYYIYMGITYFFFSGPGFEGNYYVNTMPLVLFPFIIGVKNDYDNGLNRTVFLMIFSAGVTLAVIVMLIVAVARYHGDQFWLVLNGYEPITYLIGIHPSYLSLFSAFSFFIVLHFGCTRYRYFSSGEKILFAIWLLFLGFSVYYIRSRLMTTTFSVLVFFSIFYMFPTKLRIATAAGFIILLALGYFLMVEKFHIGRFESSQVQHAIEMKRKQWDASIRVIRANPIVGVTSARSYEELFKQYAAANFQEGIDQRYNSHNQFLNTLVEGGIIGFVLWIAPLILVFLKGLKERDFLIILFVLLTALAFSTESMMTRQKGIIYYAIFVSLMAVRNSYNTSATFAKNLTATR